jgi:hypothetical protein
MIADGSGCHGGWRFRFPLALPHQPSFPARIGGFFFSCSATVAKRLQPTNLGSGTITPERSPKAMDLSNLDGMLLTWLRGLGSDPDHTFQTNTRSYGKAASMAADALGVRVQDALARLVALGNEGLVELVSRSGYSGIYYARITDDGRAALRQPTKADGGTPIVFVSCGQTSDGEIQLGAAVAKIIDDETPAKAYFAENQATFEAVSSHILDALSRCVGFVGVMHFRGEVTEPDGTSYQRASVWIEQEIAIASYRIHSLKEQIPVQLYIQKGIKREGLRDKVMLNPVSFSADSEVLDHFRSIVREKFGSVPAGGQ